MNQDGTEAIPLRDKLLTRGAVIIAVLVVGLFIAALSCSDEGFSKVVADIGFLLTGTALVLAILIYRAQSVAAKESEERILERVGKRESEIIASEAVKKPTDEPSSVDPLEDDADAAAVPASDAEVERMGVPADVAASMSVYPGHRVPLRVVSDLVQAWQATDAWDKNLDWETGEIRRAYRPRGQGNHPWYVVLVNPHSFKMHIWKVSRGGYGKTAPTATEMK